jgi:ParB family chromosome partitioning protein
MTKTSNAAFELKGRGILGGLLSEPTVSQEAQEGAAEWIAVSKIKPGRFQPRQFFSETSIESLAQSFREQGFRGAINVRPLDKDTYEIVAGERRWRAAQKANLKEVRCIIETYSDEEALEFALIENLQREDLSKLEETEGILQLIETKLGIPRDKAIGLIRTEGHSDKRGRSDVAPSKELNQIEELLSYFNVELQTFRTKNLRTLTLPTALKEAHLQKGLPYSSALELAKVKDEKAQQNLLDQALKKQLSFRDIQKEVKEVLGDEQDKGSTATINPLVTRLEATVKRAKRVSKNFERGQKRKRLEQLIKELEALLAEEER